MSQESVKEMNMIPGMTTQDKTRSQESSPPILTQGNVPSSFFQTQQRQKPERIFPGPAGVRPDGEIPERNTQESTRLYYKVKNPSKEYQKSYEDLDVAIDKAPFRKMIRQLGIDSRSQEGILKTCNIKWIKSNGNFLSSEGYKVPFLAAIIKDGINCASAKKEARFKNPSLTLKDEYGEITAALTPGCLATHGKMLVSGAALIISRCKVFATKKSVAVIFSTKSLVCITAKENGHDDDSKESTENIVLLKQNDLDIPRVSSDYHDISKKIADAKHAGRESNLEQNESKGDDCTLQDTAAAEFESMEIFSDFDD